MTATSTTTAPAATPETLRTRTARTAAHLRGLGISDSVTVGGCVVRFEFAGVVPHRGQILQAVRSHALEANGSEWLVRVSPLPEQSQPSAPGLEASVSGDGFSLQIATGAARLAHLYLDATAAKKTKDAAFVAALHAVLRREGRLDLHAAAVAPSLDDGAVLIVGPKGAGKSSLTLALALSGWTFLSDDYVLAWRNENGLAVGSLRDALFLTPDAVGRLPPGSHAGQFVRSMGKHMFQPSDLFPNQHRTQSGIAALVFPERRLGSPSTLERMRPVTAFQRLLANSPFLVTDPSAKPCLDVARALADLPAFVLHAGSDLLDPSTAARVMKGALV